MQTTAVKHADWIYVDALLAGVKWGGATGTGVDLSVSLPYFEADTALWERNYSDTNEPWNLQTWGLSLEQAELGAQALMEWSNVADVEFLYVSEGGNGTKGEIRVALTRDWSRPDTWGWGYYPSTAAAGGDVWVNEPAVEEDWSSNSYNLGSFIHEFGHALGLKHPFEDGVTLPQEYNSTQFSVMSYTDHPYADFRSVTETATSYSYEIIPIQPSTPMLLDIAAIQYIYGPNLNHATGNDLYQFDPEVPFFKTIWDAGGTDTLSVQNFNEGCVLDLRAGQFSSVAIKSDPLPAWAENDDSGVLYDGTDNLAIAFGVIIENAAGGSASDVLLGNQTNNAITGNGGDDLIDGFDGIDTLIRGETISQIEINPLGSASRFEFEVGGPLHGKDRIENIERIQCSDAGIALDLDGAAGRTAKILGVTFGPQSVNNPEYVSIGLDMLDGGMSYTDLAALALDAAGARTPEQIVDLLWFNIVGSHPTFAQMQPFIDSLTQSESAGELAAMAADLAENATNIDLLGLSHTGLVYAVA